MQAGSRTLATTVIAVARDGRLAMASDGQVTVGNTVVKQGAQKVRKAAKHEVLIGFAGGAADALALTERLEAKLEEQRGNVRRAAVELARDWRSDRALRRLEALLVVAAADGCFVLSGNGDVIEPEHDLVAIGSGGPYAQAAARALLENTALGAREIVEKALAITADICIYTNRQLTIAELATEE